MSRLLFAAAWIMLAVHTRADDPVDFNREIRPVLSNHCFQCHGPDANKREADLRLDLRDGAVADLGGYAAIVPGHADQSELIERIISTDDDLRMPPPQHGEPLSDRQRELLTRWIGQGATYARHWSFEPIERFDVPQVEDDTWNENPSMRSFISGCRQRESNPHHRHRRQH